jgi:hypothetical protein
VTSVTGAPTASCLLDNQKQSTASKNGELEEAVQSVVEEIIVRGFLNPSFSNVIEFVES